MLGSAMKRAVGHFVHAAFVNFAVAKVMINAFGHGYLMDLEPLHFHRLRDSRSGLFGSLAALGNWRIWPIDRAQ